MNQMTNPLVATSSETVFDWLEQIASTSSKNAKEELLRQHLENDAFRILIKQAIDPFVTFGVKKLPKAEPTGGELFDNRTLALLIDLKSRKLTGNAAQSAIKEELTRLQPKSAELLTRILKKSLKAGFTASTANKARPGLIYVFKCQLSHKLTDYEHQVTASEQEPWFAEMKEDGVRGFALQHQNPDGEFFSRSGKPLNASEELKQEVRFFYSMWAEHWGTKAGVVIDGELVASEGLFNDVVGDVHRKSVGDTMALKVIDLIPSDEFDKGQSEKAYTERREMLEQFLLLYKDKFPRISIIERWPVTSVSAAFELAHELIDQGHEGIILKDPNGRWANKRTSAWLKVKDINTADLVVTSVAPGEEGKEFEHCMGSAFVNFDSVDKDGNPVTVEVSVGGGWKLSEREHYWQHPGDLIGQLIEVEYHMLTPDGSMRHPRFKQIRTDKPIEDGQGC